MLRVSEFSETAVSPHTASSSSSLVISFLRIAQQEQSTRNAFGSTATNLARLDRGEFPLSNLYVGKTNDDFFVSNILQPPTLRRLIPKPSPLLELQCVNIVASNVAKQQWGVSRIQRHRITIP